MGRESTLPRLYIADLAAYNSGELHGEWIELTPDTTIEKVRDAIQAMLKQSPVLPDDVAEEFAIHDYEGFLGCDLHQYENLQTTLSIAELIREHGELGAEILSNGYAVDEATELLEDLYAGSGQSLTDWAEQFMDDIGSLDDIPERWLPYIDVGRYARDLELGGDLFTFHTSDGLVHVFWTH